MAPRSPFVDARTVRRIVGFNRASSLAGKIADLPLPKPLLKAAIRAYAKAYGVALDEARRSVEDFTCFGDFFTRELRPGLRPLYPASDVLVSPADGTLHNFGTVTNGQIPQVKGHEYSVSELLHDEALAGRFEGGSYATVYLSPKDYHRVHCPLDGTITGCRYIPGALYSVAPFSVNSLANIFVTNERIPITLETNYGLICVVLVGATIVGRITLTFSSLSTNRPGTPEETDHFSPPVRIGKGDELGAFCLGSTVVLLTEQPWEPQMLAEQMPLRFGEPLFKATA